MGAEAEQRPKEQAQVAERHCMLSIGLTARLPPTPSISLLNR
jgi:hypothetical protein